MKKSARMALAAAGMAVVCMALAAGGCVSYANYPPVPKDTAVNNPNHPAVEDVMLAGLAWVTAKYPPSAADIGATHSGQVDRFAVNVPAGVTPLIYRRVAAAGGPGSRPLTPETEHLPTYHIESIRVRGDQANIWILRPVTDLGNRPDGEPVYQQIKLWLRGGLQPWRVVSAVDSAPGVSDIPPINYYVPEPEPVMRESRRVESTYKPPPRPQPAPAEPPATIEPIDDEPPPPPSPPPGDEPTWVEPIDPAQPRP